MSNAITIIKRDHRAVKADFKRFQETKQESEKLKLAQGLFDALDAHARMEEQYFYPIVREEGNAKAKELIDGAYAEHGEMKELIERFRMEEDTEGLDMKMDELMAGVLHHVKEEEEILLPEVQKSLSDERLEELGSEMATMSPSENMANASRDE
jgi:iron-sulfur cluster repair protein YtfE (RIC family)